MKNQTFLVDFKLKPIVVGTMKIFTLCLLMIFLPDQGLKACEGTPVPPCGRSVFLGKFTPGVVVFPAAGAAIDVPIGVLPFAYWNTTGLPNAPICPQPILATLTLTLTCFPSGIVIGPLAFPVAIPIASGAQPVGGPVNFVIPAGTFPAGSPPQICLVVGTYTVTFSDQIALAFDGDTEVCIVPPTPLDASVPQLDMQYLPTNGQGYQNCRRGDQANFYFLIANNDPQLSVSLDLNSIGRQISHLPEGFDADDAYDNDVYSISLPEFGTDTYAAAFGDELDPGELLKEPDPSMQNDQALSRSFDLQPCEAIIICITMRSYGMCANGSCNERLVKVEGVFSDGSPALACASTLYVVDEMPAKTVLCEILDSVKVGPDAQAVWTPAHYAGTDGPIPHAETFAVGNLPPTNPGFSTIGENFPTDLPSAASNYSRIDGMPIAVNYDVNFNSFQCGIGQNMVQIFGLDSPNLNNFSSPAITFQGFTGPLEIVYNLPPNQLEIFAEGELLFQGPIDLFFADPPPEFCIDFEVCRIFRKRSDPSSDKSIGVRPQAFSRLFQTLEDPGCNTFEVIDNGMNPADWSATVVGNGVVLPNATGMGNLEFCYDNLNTLPRVPATTITYLDVSCPNSLSAIRIPIAIRVKDTTVHVTDLPALDNRFVLHPAAPNPFQNSTKISSSLSESSDFSIRIFNTLGQPVRALYSSKRQASGEWSMDWDGRDDSGTILSQGLYICQMNAGNVIKTENVILIR